jgi:hypothetical protein
VGQVGRERLASRLEVLGSAVRKIGACFREQKPESFFQRASCFERRPCLPVRFSIKFFKKKKSISSLNETRFKGLRHCFCERESRDDGQETTASRREADTLCALSLSLSPLLPVEGGCRKNQQAKLLTHAIAVWYILDAVVKDGMTKTWLTRKRPYNHSHT